ncbi:MAG: methenyltetrahydromethanopterin cyclohydrolase [Clostridiaceae bacterium]
MQEKTPLSKIGSYSSAIFKTLLSQLEQFGLTSVRSACGAEVLFADHDGIGAASGGALAAALCQGGLADVSNYTADFGGKTLPYVRSKTTLPHLATLTLQSADCFEGVMLSGPVKLHLDSSSEVEYNEDPSCGSYSLLVQADAVPSDSWMVSLARRAGCRPEQLTLLVSPQTRLLGAAQIAGRMNENMIFTMERSLGLDASVVASIEGYAPVCPPGAKTKRKKPLLPDDYLHYGAFSRLTLRPGAGVDAQQLANDLAFCSLSIFGTMFADLLEQAGGDFFKIPNLLHINKLALVEVFDPESGKTCRAGELRPDLLV